MTIQLNLKVAPALDPPRDGIKKVQPGLCVDFKKCTTSLQIGIFFDGTENNRDRDEPKLAHSNIARLGRAYPENNDIGYYRIYIPGVGTRFPEIGELGESNLGSGFGTGCEARVVYGLLAILNSIHDHAFLKVPLFNERQVLALCRNNDDIKPEDYGTLRALGASSGLLRPDIFGEGNRTRFLAQQAINLEARLRSAKPKIVCCYIDVFGFSRGAAQARVFCQWLSQIVFGGKLAGIDLRLRFLGIIDTVASAGVISNTTGAGHGNWAAAKFLRIAPFVENCVHMVAMHELRRCFPLDEIAVNGAMPKGCHQYAYPGAHSDVGGGYAPNALGVSVGKGLLQSDALKLSQIPLNHMLECAIAAGAPLNKALARLPLALDPGDGKRIVVQYDPFAIDPLLTQAYKDFLTTSTLTPRPIHAWLQPYLNWRWQVRQDYGHLKHVQTASKEDQKLLVKFNQILIDDAELLDPKTKFSFGRLYAPILASELLAEAVEQKKNAAIFDSEAKQVLALAKAAASTPKALSVLFDGFVHDSMAGFDHSVIECTGYWRYRKGFMGDDKALIVSSDMADAVENAA